MQLLPALVIVLSFSLLACKKDKAEEPDKVVDYNLLVETEPAVLKPVTEAISDVIGGYYKGMPFNYDKTTKNYPLLIFLHGGGQFGNGELDLPLLLNDGIAQLLDAKTFPPNFKVAGKNYSFIVLSPQFTQYPSDENVFVFLDYAKKHFRVDTTRIYMSGLSMGGIITSDMGAEFPNTLAAIVPISGVFGGIDTKDKCRNIAKSNLPVWVFHNNRDPSIDPEGSKIFVEDINSYSPAIAPRFTLFDAPGHDAWTQAINPTYKENGVNIYEWMLQYSR